MSAEATTLAVISQGSGYGSVRGTVVGASNSELGCRHSGHGFTRSWATQGTAVAKLDSRRGCTESFRARLGGGEYEVACWPTPSPVSINL